MNLPKGTMLAYDIAVDAYYWATLPPDEPYLSVMAQDKKDDGVAWEFMFVERDLGNNPPALQLQMYYDGFAALHDVPELFAALTEDVRTIADVVAVLDSLGATDITPRTNPYIIENRPSPLDVATTALQGLVNRDPHQAAYRMTAALAASGMLRP